MPHVSIPYGAWRVFGSASAMNSAMRLVGTSSVRIFPLRSTNKSEKEPTTTAKHVSVLRSYKDQSGEKRPIRTNLASRSIASIDRWRLAGGGRRCVVASALAGVSEAVIHDGLPTDG